ncbi:MBG domain-containing protein [Algoriphagus hitonicola]|uniref:Gliding motility-associated C-terminal domain-containing protein n=1 Tax=Algoriphagus hitonicola TaxID=435880 RepID=A0A1I2T5Q2_9BACT|nr:MBG domain-containing protein [Algoriphagus hitonicola]SFG57581.1 gliding motility-associated C-terminal domain-containing protein [Algoriphagus hitonicola]
MKNLYKSLGVFLTIFILGVSPLHAQCILFPGNLVFTGVNLDDDGPDGSNQNDRFSFVLLQDVSEGLEIHFTDLGWTTANSFQASDRALTDGVIKWTVPTGGVESGTQITIDAKYNLAASLGTVTGVTATGNDSGIFMDLGLSGDQLFAFTGSTATPSLIAGVNLNQSWTSLQPDKLTSSESSLPGAINVANAQNLSLVSGFQNGFSNAVISGSSFSGLFSDIVSTFNVSSNWSFDETYLPDAVPSEFSLPKSLTFTVTPFNFLNDPKGTATITYGDNTQFEVTKVDTRNITSYQWQLSTNEGVDYSDLSNAGIYSGTTTSTLVITKPPVSNTNYRYRAIAIDACGNEAISNQATLSVNPKSLTVNLIGTIEKERDGNTQAAVANENLELTGLLSGDDVAVVNPGAGTYASALPGTNILVTVTGLSISGADVENYSLVSTSTSANIGTIVDTTPPAGYSVAIDQDPINELNDTDISFTLSGAELDASYTYTFISTGGGTAVSSTGSITSATQQITGIDLSGLGNGTVTISVTLSDPSDNEGEAVTDTSVKATNFPPVAIPPTAPTVQEDDVNVTLSDDFAVADSNGDNQTLTLTITGGTLTLGTANITFGGDGNGSASFTAAGTLADINSALAGATFTPTADLNGSDAGTISFISNDGKANSNTASVSFDITAVNDAPVNTVPGSQNVDQNSTLLFNAANSNQISISDIDLGANDIDVSLTATNGRISLSATTELIFTEGTGTNDGTLRFSGSLVNVNNALDGLTFNPTAGYNGPASLEIISNDQGSTGSGGAQTDTDLISITVNSINPVVTSVNSNYSDGAYKIGDDLTISVNFSEIVTVTNGTPQLTLETGTTDRVASYLTGSNTKTLEFIYTVQEGDFTSDLDYFSNTALASNGSEIKGPTSLDATLTLPEPGATNSLSANKDIIIDGVIPTVTSVSVPSDDIYVAGETLDFTVNFSEAVVVTGTPQISLTIGSETQQASYVSGSGTSALVFSYAIAMGDLDSDGITLAGSISLNEGTLRDAAGNDANLTLNGVGDTDQVLVDALAPTVISLVIDDTSLTSGESSLVTITFSEAIAGLTLADFTVANGSLSGLSSSDGGVTWTATFTPSDGIEDETNIITLANSGFADLAGNTGTGTTDSNNYSIDTQRPAATIVVADTQLTIGETSPVTITFTEAISGLAIGDFTVQNGSISGLSTSDGGITWTATLTPSTGVEDATNVITLDNTGYVDQGGNVGTGVSNSNNYYIDTQKPSGYSVSIIPDRINGVNQNNFSFNLIDGEIGSDYSYLINSSGGGTLVTGNGTVSSANQLIDGINVSGLADGQLTLTLTLTDPAGNEGESVTDTVEKLLPAKLTIRSVQNGDEVGVDGQFEIVTDNTFAANTGLTLEIGGTATPGVDFEPIGLALVFPGNTNSIWVPVEVIDDIDVEGDETVSIQLISTDNSLVTIGNPSEATLTIADNDVPRQLTITPDFNQQKVYGDDDPTTFSYTASGFDSGDDKTIIQGSLTRESGEDAGTYSFTLGNLNAGPNYELVLNPEVFTITPAPLTITVDAGQSKVYGDVDPTFTYSASGFENGDDESILSGTLTRATGENIGNYAITLNNLSSGDNYTIDYKGADFEITPATLTITADAGQNKVYGNADPTFTYTASGFENGDNESILTGTLARAAGENVGTYALNLGTIAAGGNYTIDYTGADFEITPASLIITADAGQYKVYGEADPSLTYTASGFENGDDESILSGTLIRAAGENIGIYAITQGSLNAGDNYTIDYTGADFEITAKTLMVTTDAGQNKVYGDSDPTFTFKVTGFEGGDDESILTGALVRETGENVGNYPINLGSLDAGSNYMIIFTGADFEITPATLTITADEGQNKVYGEADPSLTYTASGFENGDDESILTGTLARTAGENVGTYAINLGTVGAGGNYTIDYKGSDFEITPANLTITADAGQNKVYGDADPIFTYSVSGFENGDDESILSGILGRVAGENVGTYAINQGSLSAGGNYSITYNGADFEITPATLTITVDASQSKIYGDADPIFTYTASGFERGDDESILTGALARETGENVGNYPISLGSLSAGDNYSIDFTGADFAITEATLTITVDANQSKVYGEADPTLIYTATGFAYGDDESILTGTLARASGENVGDYPINLGTVSAGDNYTINFVEADFTIAKKGLTITADDKQKTYGEANPTVTFTYDGLVNGDTEVETEPSITTTATAGSNVGTYPITLSGGVDQNYAITLVNGTLTIGRKDLTITADDKQKTYGEANPTLTFTYDGLVNGDMEVETEPNIATTAIANSNVGTYPITLTGGEDQNYAITLVEGTLTILPAELEIMVEDMQKIFGREDPVFIYTISGLKAGDGETVVTGELVREIGEEVGFYEIQQGSLDAGANYTIVYTAAELEIIPAVLLMINNPEIIQTQWSVMPELPETLTILTADGQEVEIRVIWDDSTLDLFSRGIYTLFGALQLPEGILNESDEKAVLQVEVLAKPAPTDITLNNDSFDPSPTVFFQEVGAFTVVDPIDDIHIIELVPGAEDNEYFEIIDGILFWSSADEAAGRTEFTVLVRVTDRDGNVLEKAFLVTRTRINLENLEVYNTFTPNGDGVNDTWGLPQLRYYQGVRLQVFDLSGERIFYSEDADVRWDGTYQGNEMPTGAYSWVIEVIETGEKRMGVLNLIRE